MDEERWLSATGRWSRLLLRLYPSHFREEMGEEVVEAYRDGARAALRRGGLIALAAVWLQAFTDSLRNGLGERMRPSIAWRRLGNWGRDSELVLRRLTRAPLFAATMIGTLAVGLGAFAAVYAVVDKILIEPLPYEQPDDLYFVWRDYGPIFDLNRGWLGGTDVAALQDVGGAIEDVAGLQLETVTLGRGATGEPQEVDLMYSTPNLFELLGAQPLLGRGFAASEVGPGRPAVVVLTHAFWRERFAADPSVVGTDIPLDGVPHTVIGVMGPEFQFVRHSSLGPPQGADLYTTFDVLLAETNPGAGSYAGLLRARPGTPPEAVATAVDQVGRTVDERDFEGEGLRLYGVGMKQDLVAGIRPALLVLGLAGVLLLVVLMMNLGTLLLVRVTQRDREFAISRALGANPVALVRATLLEAGVLGMLGGAAGALLAIWGTRALVALAPLDLPRREAIAVDWELGATIVAIGAVMGLLAGAVPAVWSSRIRLAMLLQAAAVRGGGGHGRMRRAMVVVQVALALVLLSAGGLVARSFQQLLRADPGFDPAGVLTFAVPLTEDRYPDAPAIWAAQDGIHAELAALPGVRSVGAASALPLTASASQTTVRFPGSPANTGDPERDQPLIDRLITRPDYFETLGIPLLAGPGFGEPQPVGPNEALIDRTLAQLFFPNGNAVGATLLFGEDSLVVVGVVEHARLYDIHRDDRPQVYVHNGDLTSRGLSWALRTDRSPRSLASEARAAIWRVDPELAISEVLSMNEIVAESLRQQRVSAVLIAGFSLGALLLAAMGLFGVVAGSVTRRRHELAVRMALGAERGRVLRLVVGEGMLLVALGLMVGVPGIYFSGQIISGVLVGVSPFDPLTLGAVAASLALVAFAACYVPARRVAGIEPAGLLRQE